MDRVVQRRCELQVQRTLGGPHDVRQHAAERARENDPRAARELADRQRSAGEVHAEREPPERVPPVVAVRDRVEHQVREDADRQPVLERTGFERECPPDEHVRGGDHRTERIFFRLYGTVTSADVRGLMNDAIQSVALDQPSGDGASGPTLDVLVAFTV
jgi:hypothetical protein